MVTNFASWVPARAGRMVRRTGRAAAAAMLAASMLAGATVGAGAAAMPQSFADLTDRLSPAVVNISTAQMLDGRPGVEEGSPLEDLFRDLYPDGGEGPRRVQSLGSGFVISPDGMVVTNNHVIEDADEVTVNFPDGLSLKAEVVGTDPQTDLALLKIEHNAPLPFVAFGDSDAARVGDWVLAIGNPFGFAGSVSAGIISARNRDIQAGRYDDFIQTDAAINRGNSGGPLFNMQGEVIGVNTAIISPTGGSIGIGFAVPSNLASKIVEQLQEYGVTKRGWLGVRIQTVNDELAEALGLEKPAGALVAEVTPGGPAAEAGIQAGDVILNFDGNDVTEMRELPRMVADTEVGKTVRVTVFREGKTQTLKTTVGLLNEEGEAAAAAADEEEVVAATELPRIGLTVRPLSETARVEYGISEDIEGVLVSEVADGGAAAEKGVRPGDVIVEVGQEMVRTPAEVEEQVANAADAGRKSVLFLIHSQGDLRFVPLTLAEDG